MINRRDSLTVKHIIINVVSFQTIQFISKYIHSTHNMTDGNAEDESR